MTDFQEMLVKRNITMGGNVVICEGVKLWHNVQIRNDVIIGDNCIIGRGAYIGVGVRLGRNCKVQNYACIYEGARIQSGVFIGPHAIITNDKYPRAVNPDMSLKGGEDWEITRTLVEQGASIGAGAVIIGGAKIGEWAMVGARAVVTEDVPPHAMVVGNPARIIGYVSRDGRCRTRKVKKGLVYGEGEKVFIYGKSGQRVELTKEQYKELLECCLSAPEKQLVEHHRRLSGGGIVVGERMDNVFPPPSEKGVVTPEGEKLEDVI